MAKTVPYDKMTKAQLVAALKKADRTIARLNRKLVDLAFAPVTDADIVARWTPPWAAALTNSFEE